MVQPQFAAVDWGTSSFRLWLIGAGDVILGESRSGEGMTTARETGFAAVLEHHLAKVDAPAELPVIVCGMAGAKQGWVEAGYIDVPAKLSTIADKAVRVEAIARDVRILPGLAQRDPHAADVIRGEETQLLGCSQSMKSSDCLVAMPGTHSKWVRIVRDEALGFAPFPSTRFSAIRSRIRPASTAPTLPSPMPSIRPTASRNWPPTGCFRCGPAACCSR